MHSDCQVLYATACPRTATKWLRARWDGGNPRGLIATVVGVTYLTPDDQVGDPSPDAVPEGGDTFRLEFVFPNLLKATTLHSSNPDHLNLLGNPYFCRDGLAREVSFACGA